MAIRDRLRRLISPQESQRAPAAGESPSARDDSAPTERPDHELVLYKYDACPFCRRVMRVVDELGLQDTIEYRDTRRSPEWRSDLIQRTGRTQVPCLFIDGQAMFESADIADWLRSNYA